MMNTPEEYTQIEEVLIVIKSRVSSMTKVVFMFIPKMDGKSNGNIWMRI